MRQEIDRILGVLQEKIKELAQLRHDYNQVQNNTQHYKEIESKLVSSLKELENMVIQLDQERKQKDSLQEKIIQNEGQINSLRRDIIELQQEKEGHVYAINQKNQELQQQQFEINKYKDNYKQLGNKYAQLEVRLILYRKDQGGWKSR